MKSGIEGMGCFDNQTYDFFGEGYGSLGKSNHKTVQATTLRLRVILFQNKSNKLTQYKKKKQQKKQQKPQINLQKAEKNLENLRVFKKVHP